MIALVFVACGKKTDEKKLETVVTDTTSVKPNGQLGQIDTARQQSSIDESTSAPETLRQQNTDPLKRKRWKLIQLNGERIEVTEDFRSEPYITLSANSNKMTGSGGCNRFGCKYTLMGEKISFAGLATTKVNCEQIMSVESQFLDELQKVTGYTLVDENSMWLLRDGKKVMKFEMVTAN